MTLIDKNGERPACDRCHRVRVVIRRGSGICADCRHAEEREAEDARAYRDYLADLRRVALRHQESA